MKKLLFVFLLLQACTYLYGQISVEDYNRSLSHVVNARKLIKEDAYLEAIAELETSIKIDSAMHEAYLLLYTACYHTNNEAKCIAYLKQAKTIFLEDDEIIFFLGKSHQNMKNYEAALIEYNEAIALSKVNGEDFPLVTDYYANRGICYLRQEKFQVALADFDYALKLNYTRKDVYTNRGYALYKLKKFEEACLSWRTAYDLGEGSAKQYIDKNCK